MSVMLDVMGEDGVDPGSREVLCTHIYLGDLASELFVDTTRTDFTDYGELKGLVTYIIEVYDTLIDPAYHDDWLVIRKIFPAFSSVVNTVDTLSVLLANTLEMPSTLFSNIDNIAYNLEKKTWAEFLVGESIFEFDENEGIAIPLDFMEQVGFEDDDVVTVVGVRYRNISDIMGTNKTGASASVSIRGNSTFKPRVLSLDVVSLTVVKESDLSHTPVSITYRLHNEEQIRSHQEVICVYWDFTDYIDDGGFWSNEGCTLVESSTGPDSTLCMCNHTTNFGLLVLDSEEEETNWHFIILTWLMTAGGGVSAIALTVILAIMLHLSTLNARRRMAQCSFIFSYLILMLLYGLTQLADIDPWACMGFGLASHLFILTSSCWLFVIGTLLFTRVTDFTKGEMKTWHCIAVGWVLPISITGGLGGWKYAIYGSGTRCWLNASDTIINAAYFYPPIVTSAATLFMLLFSIRAIGLSKKHALFVREQDELNKIKGTCWCFLVILASVDLTILSGVKSFDMEMLGYAFGGLICIQGLVVLLAELILNSEIKVAWQLKKNPPVEIKDEDDEYNYDLDDKPAKTFKINTTLKLVDYDDDDDRDIYSEYSSRPGTSRSAVSAITVGDIQYEDTFNNGNSLRPTMIPPGAGRRSPRRSAGDGASQGRNSADGGRRDNFMNEFPVKMKGKGGYGGTTDYTNVFTGYSKKGDVSNLLPKPKRTSIPGSIDEPDEVIKSPVPSPRQPVSPAGRKSVEGRERSDLGERLSPDGGYADGADDGGYQGDYNEGYDEEGYGDDYGDYDENYDENYDGNYDENYDGNYDENYDENYDDYEYDENEV